MSLCVCSLNDAGMKISLTIGNGDNKVLDFIRGPIATLHEQRRGGGKGGGLIRFSLERKRKNTNILHVSWMTLILTCVLVCDSVTVRVCVFYCWVFFDSLLL